MLLLADVFFFVFHTGLMAFNGFGWMFRRTRRWTLYTLLATGFSWFVMGLWNGIGYCVCTDIHMGIRRARGIEDTAETYVQLVVQVLTGQFISADAAAAFTGGAFAVSFLGCILLVLRDNRRANAEEPRQQYSQ